MTVTYDSSEQIERQPEMKALLIPINIEELPYSRK